MSEPTYGLRIPMMTPEQVTAALDHAPVYEAHVARAIKRTIRTIHGIPDVHENAELERLEVYVGRATDSTVASRFKSHLKERQHKWGLVLFRTAPDKVAVFERIAIKILARLKQRGKLCVAHANIVPGSPGGAPRRNEHAVVYLTWRVRAEAVAFERPGIADVREIASEVAREVGDVSARRIATGLAAVKALAEREAIWLPERE